MKDGYTGVSGTTNRLLNIIVSNISIKESFEALGKEMKKTIDFDRMIIALLEGEYFIYYVCYSMQGISGILEPGKKYAVKNSSLEYFKNCRETLINNDLTRQVEFWVDKALVRAGIKSIICLPLAVKGELIGSLSLSSLRTGTFTAVDVKILEVVSPAIAVACHNSHLYEQLLRDKETARQEEEQARKQIQQLIETEKGQTILTIAAGIAHDFNNRLAIILGNIELALRKPMASEVRDFLEAAREASLDCAAIVKGLNQVARPTLPGEIESVDINEVVRQAIQLTSPRWKDQALKEGKTIDIVTELANSALVNGSRDGLNQVLTNLLLNAVEAMPGSGEIKVNTEINNNKVVIHISDSGIGIPQEVLPQLFTPFFTTKGPSSSGLGLAVSRSIVRVHKGDLSIESQPGKGTRVCITLPLATDKSEKAGGKEIRSPAGKFQILLVDDEGSVGRILKQMLEAEGYSVDVETSPLRALEIFPLKSYDLVLTDLGMPAMNGWQLAEKIKQISSKTPVILVTGWATTISPKDINDKKLDGLLHKPFDLSEINRIINNLLKK